MVIGTPQLGQDALSVQRRVDHRQAEVARTPGNASSYPSHRATLRLAPEALTLIPDLFDLWVVV
jgi:hypothetical protein